LKTTNTPKPWIQTIEVMEEHPEVYPVVKTEIGLV
jgi:hypothetical protein